MADENAKALGENLSKALESNAMLLPDCKCYLRTLLLFAPASMLQMLFQMFFVTAGKPGLGLGVTIAGGVANAIFDYVFMAVCHMDITGAAIATGVWLAVPLAEVISFVLCLYIHRRKRVEKLEISQRMLS